MASPSPPPPRADSYEVTTSLELLNQRLSNVIASVLQIHSVTHSLSLSRVAAAARLPLFFSSSSSSPSSFSPAYFSIFLFFATFLTPRRVRQPSCAPHLTPPHRLTPTTLHDNRLLRTSALLSSAADNKSEPVTTDNRLHTGR
ncbi:hypothetical protein M9H77_02084 [Catharanthus roseus]|uniref:Uncharacterized protein n=1 Tax=Catharanthus roseus TaxID=4058 RepID=A0ACC0C7E4_CATRO|nr:hypothetical protein M9H77_02084 [Catharanthus roseus]